MKTILYIAADLVWATRIKSTAEGLGIVSRPVRKPEMLAARLGESDVTAFIVDLDAGEMALTLIRGIKGWESERDPNGGGRGPIRVVAFGPHVETELFAAAREAGADHVMTRGAFSGRLVDVLKELAGGGEG